MKPIEFTLAMACLTAWSSGSGSAQQTQVTAGDYARAEQFLPWNFARLVRNVSVTPHWLAGAERFWYQRETSAGHEFLLVDPARATRSAAFDHAGVAAALARASGRPHDATKLPLTALAYPAPDSVSFSLGGERWTCHTGGSACARSSPSPPTPAADRLPSPDGRWLAYAEANDLFVRSTVDGTVRRLTVDGEPDNGFGTRPDAGQAPVSERRLGVKRPPAAVWSPDSRKLISHRLDQRGVTEQVVVDASATPIPEIHRFRAPNPGDFVVPRGQLVIFDIESGRAVPVALPPLFAIYFTAFDFDQIWWSEDGTRVYVLAQERAWKGVRFFEVNATTGAARLLHEESSDTFIELTVDWGGAGHNVRVLGDGAEFIWFSEREGWARLYLHDGATGRLKQRITDGDWVVRTIQRVDQEARQLYFTASGREPGRDPYFAHLYRIGLDGTGLTLLTPEDAEHAVRLSPSGRYFVDTYSRVDQAPVTVLRSADGELVMRLEEADLAALRTAGWTPPERFTVKARDGKTDLYGVLFRPTNFDPSRSYPIVDDYYPGAQRIRTPKAFSAALGGSQATAELGFVVVILDGMGTALRSKAFHNVSYRNFADATLPDHIAGIRQLAGRYPYLDIDRVGIHGASAGGYGSARAILEHPDFFKVAVSASGNTTPRAVLAFWAERWFGFPVGDFYDEQDNARLAGNLKGKLLLAWGDIDDTVPPYQTQQLVSALVKANKDVDLLVVPGANHGAAGRPYAIRRRWDYFVKHLLGAEPPAGYEIAQPRTQ